MFEDLTFQKALSKVVDISGLTCRVSVIYKNKKIETHVSWKGTHYVLEFDSLAQKIVEVDYDKEIQRLGFELKPLKAQSSASHTTVGGAGSSQEL